MSKKRPHAEREAEAMARNAVAHQARVDAAIERDRLQRSLDREAAAEANRLERVRIDSMAGPERLAYDRRVRYERTQRLRTQELIAAIAGLSAGMLNPARVLRRTPLDADT